MNHFAIWIDDLLGAIEKDSSPNAINLIERCGAGCAARSQMMEIMARLRDEASGCKNLTETVAFLNGRLPGSVIQTEDGIIVHAVMGKCSCKMAPEITTNSAMLCNCTKGYQKTIWSEFFGKGVEVEILETILRGGNECVFRVRV